MSTVHDRVMVVVGHVDSLIKAHEAALKLFSTKEMGELVSPILKKANGVESFMIGTSGSKEGWATCEEHHQLLREFAAWLECHPEEYWKWAIVTFPDEGRTRIKSWDTVKVVPSIPPARLDAERTAKPKTRLLGHVHVPDDGRAHAILQPTADTIEDVETGERVELKK